jgi:hypothetical protein
MKKMLMTTAAGAALALAFASAPSRAAQWDGADDLPTSPLACGTGANPAPVSKPYDGG